MTAELGRDGTDNLVIASTLLAGRRHLHAGRKQVRSAPGTSLLAPQRGELRASRDDVTLNVVALDGHLLSNTAFAEFVAATLVDLGCGLAELLADATARTGP